MKYTQEDKERMVDYFDRKISIPDFLEIGHALRRYYRTVTKETLLRDMRQEILLQSGETARDLIINTYSALMDRYRSVDDGGYIELTSVQRNTIEALGSLLRLHAGKLDTAMEANEAQAREALISDAERTVIKREETLKKRGVEVRKILPFSDKFKK